MDRSVETFTVEQPIGEEALPAREPYFVFNGDKDGTYAYSCNNGFTKTVNDAILTLSAGASTRISSVTLHTESAFVNLPDVDLVTVDGANRQALLDAGLDWMAGGASNLGYVDFSGLVNQMMESGATGTATFTLTLTDGVGQQVNGTFSVNVQPFAATVNIPDGNIWAWKMTGITATVTGVDEVPADATLGLQWSTDGSNWSSEKAAVSVSGNTVQFGDIAGLTPATAYRFRVVPMHLTERASATANTFTTEAALQVGNSDFESYTQQTSKTTHYKYYPITIGTADWTITWWQLYSSVSTAWWGVNSPRTIEDETVPQLNQDMKTYPTVALISSGAYSGKSVMIATIYTSTMAVDNWLGAGTHHNYYGEIFLGTANNSRQENWAKTQDGHAFTSRPSALSFMHRFSPKDGTPFYAEVSVLDAQGNVIGNGVKNDTSSDVSAWTRCTVPINYTVTNRKAATLRISLRSSRDGNEDWSQTSVTTLSGSHTIFLGNSISLQPLPPWQPAEPKTRCPGATAHFP